MPRPRVDILMYHSISDRGGPTSIPAETFASQMAALAASGRPIVTMDDLADRPWPDGGVAITFDDAFQDFADTAWPILTKHDLPAMVYVPTGRVGASENWTGALTPPRPIMGWDAIRRLAEEGCAFGNHTVSHPDLTRLDATGLADEIGRARATLERELGREVRHFAPPYGRTTDGVRRAIAKHHRTSVGTRLARAEEGDDLHDLPRLEMFYFRSLRDWQRHLDGRGGSYLAMRRALRAVRSSISHPAERA